MISVYLDSIREQGPRDRFGATSWVIGEVSNLVFTGEPNAAALYLERDIPVGTSVCVRHKNGLRSCMNKPSLWAWVQSL